MNSTLKNTLLVVGAIVIIWLIVWFVGRTQNGENINQSATTTSTNSSDDAITADKNVSNGITKNTSRNTSYSGTGASVPAGGLSDSVLAAVIAHARVRVPQTGVDATLSGGEADYVSGAVKGHISVGNVITKVPTDNGYDVFVEMTVTKEGSPSVLNYVGLFHNVDLTVSYTSATLIGDRLVISSIVASPDKAAVMKKPQVVMDSYLGYIITITYLDRRNTEPFTTPPSVVKTVSPHVREHVLTS